jgi:hypothetical protein
VAWVDAEDDRGNDDDDHSSKNQAGESQPASNVEEEQGGIAAATDSTAQRRTKERTAKKNSKARNTESFTPSHDAPDMRIIVGRNAETFQQPFGVHDVVMVPELFCPTDVSSRGDCGIASDATEKGKLAMCRFCRRNFRRPARPIHRLFLTQGFECLRGPAEGAPRDWL